MKNINENITENITLIIDITLLETSNRIAGIVRKEIELVNYLLYQHKSTPCIFISTTWDKKSLRIISRKKVIRFLKKFEQVKKINPNLLAFFTSIKKYITFFLPKKYDVFINKFFNIYIELGFIETLIRIAQHSLQKIAQRFFYKNKSQIAYTHFPFKKNDVFISTSIPGSESYYALYSEIKKKYGIVLVGTLYDVIPVTHPNYFEESQSKNNFSNHVKHLNYLFDRVACISDFSKKEFIKLCESHQKQTLPTVKTIHLGNTIISNKNTSLFSLKKKPYILFVSTIEIRKNHLALLNAFLKLKDYSIELPDLICVGKMGWKIEETLNLYNNNPFLKEKIHFLNYVNDQDLANLYQNCLFTVFPSYIEGWGLGAAESLAYGKICLISTADALNEATNGIMPRIPPDDPEAWMKEIYHLATNPIEIKKLEAKIKQHFKVRKWETFAKEFIEFALSLKLC